jgi:hypothetical protein
MVPLFNSLIVENFCSSFTFGVNSRILAFKRSTKRDSTLVGFGQVFKHHIPDSDKRSNLLIKTISFVNKNFFRISPE